MTPERWEKIDRLFNEILELDQDEQKKVLEERCGNDFDLLQKVQSLLSAHKQADEFIENSAIKVVAKNLAKDKTKTSNYLGKTFSSYTIKKLIGEGGMGEVYLAFDEKLKREVAVKILPDEYTASEERVNRFQREAQAISALNHPNILTIYDVGTFENSNYIATELVKGKTLREYVVKGMSLRGILNVIIQCCDALAAAHNAGIIHRDIKPENIMVRSDGYVKILDFGLAKLSDVSTTETKSFTGTVKEMIIGTPAYISPEQLAVENVDHRTDIWGIGLILYELVTGINPFKKKTRSETFRAIKSGEPPPASSLNSEVCYELDRVLKKSLQKNTDSRYQTVESLREDLIAITREINSSKSQFRSSGSLSFRAGHSRFANYFGFLLLSVFTISIPFFIWYVYFNEKQITETDWTNAKNIQLTSQAGSEIFPSFASDGDSFVYATKNQDNFDIFLQRVGGKKSINLTDNSPFDDTQPAFSPDGKFIAFRSERNGGGIFIMEETGENPRRVSDLGFHPSWSPDGKQIVVSQRGYERPTFRDKSALWIINLENSAKRKLIENFANQPSWSPNGRRIAYWFIQSGGRRDVATIQVEGGEPTIVTNSANTNWNPVWSPDGKYLYYSSDQSGNMAFWRVRIDETTGEILGKPEIVPTPAKFNSHLTFSKDGNRLIYVQTNNQSNIKAVGFDEKAGKIRGEPFWVTKGDYEIIRPRLSPDGKQFAAHLARQTQDDIVILDRDGKNWIDLTNDKFFDRYPRWSPDGKQIAFASDRSGVYEVWLMNSDGTNLRQITHNRKSGTSFPIWSPDGKNLTYHIGIETFILDLTQDLEKQTPRKLPLFDDLKYLVWDWSPDGKKFAGNWGDYQGNSGIGYLSLETNEYFKITNDNSEFPFWLSDSRRLLWVYKGKIFIADTKSKKTAEILSLPDEIISSVGISADYQLLYFTVSSSESNLWLLDLTDITQRQ